MATLQTDGISAVTSTSTDNNGGTIKSNSTTLTGTFQISQITQPETAVFGSTAIDGTDTDPALSGGVFAYNNESPISKKLSTSLSTVSNSVLLSGAAQPALVRSIHKLEVLRTRQATKATRENRFNIYTGKYDSGYPLVVVDSLGTDNAAIPTRSNPGSFNYKYAAPSIVSDNYEAKTG